MPSKLFLSLSVAVFVAGSASFAHAQSMFAAQEHHLPIAVGVGMSNFDVDYGKDASGERRMEGLTSWVAWDLPHATGILNGFGMEIEGRDVNFGRPSSLTRMRQDTVAGGAVYSWRHYRYVQPHFKYLMGIGSIDFPSHNPRYTHDTRAITAPGVGLEGKVFGRLWVRADYEYQFWPRLFGPHTLNPNGFTFGTLYDFRPRSISRY